MSRKVLSMKGDTVDFDLLEIKNQITASPKPEEVVRRERFIDKKRRRNPNRKIGDMLAEQADSQRYAKEMIDAQRAARNADQSQTVEQDIPEVLEQEAAAPQRLNRKINNR